MLHTCPNCDVTCAQSATQWTASVHTLHTLHTSRNLGWGGGGGVGCNDMHCTCTHIRCHAILLAHMFDATQWHLRTCWMLRNWTCAHGRCYAIGLAHMFDATQLHLGTYRCYAIALRAHVRCYAIALAHMFDATQLHLRTSPRSCPKHISAAKKVRNELVSSGLDFTKMGYRLSFYIKMSVWLTGASWRADQVVFLPNGSAKLKRQTHDARMRMMRMLQRFSMIQMMQMTGMIKMRRMNQQ